MSLQLQSPVGNTDNEFFDLVDDAVSKSSIHPDNNNNSFDKCQLDDEQGIDRPFTPSEGHNSQDEAPKNQTVIEHEVCPNCSRKFFKGRLNLHLKSCTSEKPLKILKTINSKFLTKLKDELNASSKSQNQFSTPKKHSEDQQQKKRKFIFLNRQPKWKQEHEKMLQNVKAVKDKEMIFCQYCQRRFASRENQMLPKDTYQSPPRSKQQQQQEAQKSGFKALEKYSQYIGIYIFNQKGSSINEEQEEVDDTQHYDKALLGNTHQSQYQTSREIAQASRFSQSQQKEGNNSQTAFLPKIQTKAFQVQSNEFHVPLLSRSTPAIQCPSCHRSFDQRAGERHIPICEKVMNRQKMISGGNDSKNKRYICLQNINSTNRQKKINIKELSPQHTYNNIQCFNNENRNLIPFSEGSQFCTNCGAKFANNHKYCGNCGKRRL